MKDDPIVEEVRAAREAIFAQHQYDLDALCADLQQRTDQAAARGQPVVAPPQLQIGTKLVEVG